MVTGPEAEKQEPLAQAASSAGVASDPEEDDLSDLDDVLDEFSNIRIESKPSPKASRAEQIEQSTASTSASGPGRPKDLSPAELLLENEDEFAKQLQKEMEHLLGQGDFQKQFEDIMREVSQSMGENPLHEAPLPTGDAKKITKNMTASQRDTAVKAEKSFQDTIKKTMERMQESGDAASSATAASSSEDDLLAQMMKELENGGLSGEGNGDDFGKVLMGMMEQLTNKEILYEPLKELNDKFPLWMEEHKNKVGKEDLKRYQEQEALVHEIVTRFERKGYSDENAQDREYIVERMQKMQAAGSPPPDLVGNMNAAQEALQDIDQGCPTQ